MLLQALVGEQVTIETRTGLVLTGILANVDNKMNITMSEAITPTTSFPSLYIAGRQIVFAHLPDNLDIGRAIDEHVAKQRARIRR